MKTTANTNAHRVERIQTNTTTMPNITGEQLAEYQVGVWQEAGFEATEMRVNDDPNGNEPECTYVVCKANYCERVKLKEGPMPAQIVDVKLAKRLLFQPLALAACIGIMVLMGCVDGTIPSSIATPLMDLVGGKQNALTIYALAILAHIFEALYAWYVCISRPLNQPKIYAIRWAWLVMLAGYPILRRLKQLRHIAQKHDKKLAAERRKD